jgi:hypothetical protein
MFVTHEGIAVERLFFVGHPSLFFEGLSETYQTLRSFL